MLFGDFAVIIDTAREQATKSLKDHLPEGKDRQVALAIFNTCFNTIRNSRQVLERDVLETIGKRSQ